MRCENALLCQRLAALAVASAVVVDAAGISALECPVPATLHLRLGADADLDGDVRARIDAWPMDDQSVDVVILRHALDFTGHAHARALLGEALRVAARGGHVLIAGVHPCSLWYLWTLPRMRAAEPAYHARLPWQLESWMRADGMRIEPRLRYGGIVPDNTSSTGGGPVSACYLLHARRASSTVTPIKLARTRPTPAAVNASLVGVTQRQRAR